MPETIASRPLPDWAEMVRPLKLQALAFSDEGAMPPVVIAFRGDVRVALAIAPQVDRDLGLDACLALRRGLDADELVFAVDAHVFAGKGEGSYEEARKRWPGGRMQAACDEDGACARGELMDCLHVIRVDRSGRIASATIGYHYHGKASGTPFRWDDSPWWASEAEHSAKIGGLVADSLREIMATPSIIETAMADPTAAHVFGEMMRRHPGRCEAIGARACLQLLAERGYQVMGAERG